ncbi:DUF6049 family protein, partial [Streptomyces massasporeus]
MTFTVKVSEITATVMLVIAGGVLLLVLAGVRMYSQRKRVAARNAEAEAAETATIPEEPEPQPESGADPEADTPRNPEAPAEEPDADEPEQPSDPTPDTGPESGDPSGTGEKVDR